MMECPECNKECEAKLCMFGDQEVLRMFCACTTEALPKSTTAKLRDDMVYFKAQLNALAYMLLSDDNRGISGFSETLEAQYGRIFDKIFPS